MMAAAVEKHAMPERNQRGVFSAGVFQPRETSLSREEKRLIEEMFTRRKEALDDLAKY